ncbi:hypothetical protein V6Z05_03300 [Leptospira venezuelensis]|uniref:hypothetical protein n=1 Tax=Leptospira venezuelensis TaxID=1958811 RepID=UPI000A38F817|nr:hypothetical protein [Leptospira venezuelensis]
MLFEYWDKENVTDLKVIEYFAKKYPEKILKYVRITLNRIDKDPLHEFSLEAVLKLAFEQDYENTVQVLSSKLTALDVHSFQVLAKFGRNYHHNDLKSAFLRTLKTEDNTYIIISAIRVLGTYKDPNLEKELMNIYSTNSKMKSRFSKNEIKEILTRTDWPED